MNAEKAFHLFKHAGQLGEPTALCNVGAMYFHGNGTEKNYEKAFYAYQNAAALVRERFSFLFDLMKSGFSRSKYEPRTYVRIRNWSSRKVH